jgi:hypothetical protein
MYTNDLNALSLDNFMFLRLWSATAPATLLAESKQSRPISLVLLIITCSSVTMIPIWRPRCWTGRRHRSKATDFTPVTFGHVLPSCDGKSALAAQARVIAKRLLRNIAVKQSCIFGNFSPDSQRAARATCLFARGPRDKGLFDQAQ